MYGCTIRTQPASPPLASSASAPAMEASPDLARAPANPALLPAWSGRSQGRVVPRLGAPPRASSARPAMAPSAYNFPAVPCAPRRPGWPWLLPLKTTPSSPAHSRRAPRRPGRPWLLPLKNPPPSPAHSPSRASSTRPAMAPAAENFPVIPRA
jgi:hypothetical protein